MQRDVDPSGGTQRAVRAWRRRGGGDVSVLIVARVSTAPLSADCILAAMPVLESHVDTGSAEFRENLAHMDALEADLRARLAEARAGGGEEAVQAPARAGQAARARARRAPARSGHALPGDRRPGRPRPVRRRRALRGHRHRHRPRARPRGHGGGQRRHREGRHLLPAHGEEAPARAGDRAGEPAALRVPGGLRRRLPAPAGRGLPRPRPLRPHLLQRGAHERAGHPADQRGARLLHGGRRLRAGHERRGGDREGPRHHLPGRPAPREGGHRRGGDRGGAGRGRRATAASAAWPTTTRSTTSTRSRSRATSWATSPRARSSPGTCGEPEDPLYDPRGDRRSRPRRASARPTTCAR